MKPHGPWQILNSKIAYQTPYLHVTEDQVLRPDGKPGIFSIVHFKPGVSVLPIDEQNNVYLTEEFKYALGRNSLEVVSGAIEENEPILNAAKRELKEELGIRAQHWIDLGTLHPFTSAVNSPAYLFLAKDLTFTTTNPEGTEQIKMIKKPLNQAIQLVLDSQITQGQSVALILKAKAYLETEKKKDI